MDIKHIKNCGHTLYGKYQQQQQLIFMRMVSMLQCPGHWAGTVPISSLQSQSPAASSLVQALKRLWNQNQFQGLAHSPTPRKLPRPLWSRAHHLRLTTSLSSLSAQHNIHCPFLQACLISEGRLTSTMKLTMTLFKELKNMFLKSWVYFIHILPPFSQPHYEDLFTQFFLLGNFLIIKLAGKNWTFTQLS